MKKITVIFSILFITFTGTVFAQERVQYDKAASEKFKKKNEEDEKKIQIYVSDQIELLYYDFDTNIVFKNGHPKETITDNSQTVVIRYKEKGKIQSWKGDTVWVSFDTKNSGTMTLPFKPAASGSGNKNNVLRLALDQECEFLPGGQKICKDVKQVTLQDKTFKVISGVGSYLEYEPKLKTKDNQEKIVSKGHKVK